VSEQATAATKRPKGRSPAYPAINLEIAIRRTRQLYDRARQHPTPVSTIVNYWQYKSLNGPAAQTLAALVKYGLVDYEGTGTARKAKVSSLGHVILAHPDEAEREAAIRRAALQPAIHREMWEKYGEDLPPDETLYWELTQTRSFTETGAKEFIPVYRATVAFAQLASLSPAELPGFSDQAVDRSDGNYAEAQPEHTLRPSGATLSGTGSMFIGVQGHQGHAETTRSFPIPLVGGGVVVVEGEFPLTERDWSQFIAVLNAMKPGLVAGSPNEDPDQLDDLAP
jgi:hypothetical protein